MKTIKHKYNATKTIITCSVLAASLSFGTAAFAFSDLAGNPAEVKINALQASGVISGVTQDLFAPKSKVTYAQGVQLLSNAFNLRLTNPQSNASDYFAKVVDNAWYSEAFVIAQQNGLSIDKKVSPTNPMTRAQFAHLLHQALLTKGNFPVTTMFFNISDGEKLPQDVSNSLQALLNMKMITLGEDGTFRPNEAITRAEAAVLIYNATELAKRILPEEVTTPNPAYEAIVSVEKATDGVNKVSLTVDNLPNPGYAISIDRIEFGKNLSANVYFSVSSPDPNNMYIQVISKSTAITYLPDNYKVVAKYEATSSEISPFTLLRPYPESPTTSIEDPENLFAK